MSSAAEDAADDSAQYLIEKNFKSICEWVITEALFAKPDDPLAFIRDVADRKIQERDGQQYRRTDPEEYTRDCYRRSKHDAQSEASAAAASSMASSAVDLRNRVKFLEGLLSASRAIAAELDPQDATSAIISHACQLLQADRCTLFRMDSMRGEEPGLVLMVARGAESDSIRVQLGQGIAGQAAAEERMLNITDAYDDPRFDPSYDRQTGYHTRSTLAVPIRDYDGAIVGVLQAINKLSTETKEPEGSFDKEDEETAHILALHAGIALRNAQLFNENRRSHDKVRAMLDVVRALHTNDLSATSLMFTMTTRATALVNADRCTFFLADHADKELWCVQGDVDIRVPMDRGIVGAVAQGKKTVNIRNAYEDSRFNPDVDRASGYRTRAVLCMPIVAQDGETLVGVIQLMNKVGDPSLSYFVEEDEEVMETFLTLVAPLLERSHLFQSRRRKLDPAQTVGTEWSGRPIRPHQGHDELALAAAAAGPAIAEGEEDEDEDDDDDDDDDNNDNDA